MTLYYSPVPEYKKALPSNTFHFCQKKNKLPLKNKHGQAAKKIIPFGGKSSR
jgi:hypothetical protein